MATLLKLITQVIFLSTVLSAPSQEIHHHMTTKEIMEAFHTDGTEVPPYEVIEIHSSLVKKREKREINAGHIFELKAFDQRVKSWITPTDGILAGSDTPICGVRSTAGGIVITPYPKAMEKIESMLYHNKESRITMTVNQRPDGSRAMNGIIGDKNWYVTPVPDRLRNSINRYRRSVDDIKSEYEDKSYHFVFEIPKTHHNTTLMAPLTQSTRTKRSAGLPSIVYPEVLVIVDYYLYQQLGGSYQKAVPYLLSFWNGVDMKYRGLQNPRYRLNIAAIFLAEDPNALIYLERSKINKIDSIDAHFSLQMSSQWLHRHTSVIPSHLYDVAVTMTKYQLYMRNERNGAYDEYIFGRAWIGGACQKNNEYGDQRSAVMHDDGAYGGIHTAAHELGHLLGAIHDGTDHRECPKHLGNIMAGAPILDSDNSYNWSPCSLNDLSNFFRRSDASCLYNEPKPGRELPRLLPGKILNADRQCSIINRNTVAMVTPQICKRLTCLDLQTNRPYTDWGWSAADGTNCARGKICLYGDCVDENVIG